MINGTCVHWKMAVFSRKRRLWAGQMCCETKKLSCRRKRQTSRTKRLLRIRFASDKGHLRMKELQETITSTITGRNISTVTYVRAVRHLPDERLFRVVALRECTNKQPLMAIIQYDQNRTIELKVGTWFEGFCLFQPLRRASNHCNTVRGHSTNTVPSMRTWSTLRIRTKKQKCRKLFTVQSSQTISFHLTTSFEGYWTSLSNPPPII